MREAKDRLLGTSITANWSYRGTDIDFAGLPEAVRHTLIDTFAEHKSRSVQHTLYAMGEAVLAAHPDVVRIQLLMPNVHNLLVDLSPFGLDNPNEIFLPIDEPHGSIAATVERKG